MQRMNGPVRSSYQEVPQYVILVVADHRCNNDIWRNMVPHRSRSLLLVWAIALLMPLGWNAWNIGELRKAPAFADRLREGRTLASPDDPSVKRVKLLLD